MKPLPVFFAAPHRLMFLTGTVQALVAMVFWSLDVGAHYAGLWPVPAWPLLTLGFFASMLLWLGAFALWAWRYAPAFWRPRSDGRPG